MTRFLIGLGSVMDSPLVLLTQLCMLHTLVLVLCILSLHREDVWDKDPHVWSWWPVQAAFPDPHEPRVPHRLDVPVERH